MVRFSALPSDAPERTQAKVPEGQTKANSYDYPARPALPGFVLGIFTCHRQAAYARQEQENKACDLKPELCSTRPHEAALARPAFMSALNVRLRLACLAATRARIPIFRAVERLTIRSILSMFSDHVRGYNTPHGEHRHATL